MNRLFSRLAGLMLAVVLLTSLSVQKTYAQDVTVSYQNFYDELAPYGQWIDDPYYGNVFVPAVGNDFRPYASDGYWASTEYGNMWVSDQPWSWACYHYGRWTYNEYYGWIWIPGYKWAPAWVSWRSGGGFYGWAPLGPGVRIGVSYDYPESYWVFVTPMYLYHRNVYSYYERERVHECMRYTRYERDAYESNGTRYYYGPRREVIARETNRPVELYRVTNVHEAREGRVAGNELHVYRPNVNRDTRETARPTHVISANEHPMARTMQAIPASHATTERPFQREMQNNPNRSGGMPGGRPAPEQARPGQQVEHQAPQQGVPNRLPEHEPNRQPSNMPQQTMPTQREPQRQPMPEREPQLQQPVPQRQPNFQEPQRQPMPPQQQPQPQREPQRQPMPPQQQPQPQREPQRQPMPPQQLPQPQREPQRQPMPPQQQPQPQREPQRQPMPQPQRQNPQPQPMPQRQMPQQPQPQPQRPQPQPQPQRPQSQPQRPQPQPHQEPVRR